MWTFNFEDDSDEERMLESNTDSIGAASGDRYWNTRDFILFAIDCSQSMFPANVTVALECCRSVLENKIISSERDMV